MVSLKVMLRVEAFSNLDLSKRIAFSYLINLAAVSASTDEVVALVSLSLFSTRVLYFC